MRCKLLTSVLLTFSLTVVCYSMGRADGPDREGDTVDWSFRDDFSGFLSPDWRIVRPDKSHYSISSHHGKLVITTQAGTVHNTGREPAARNLFFVELPEEDAAFVATTHLEGFWPEAPYQQAGLMVHADDDNYLKFVCEYGGDGPPVLNLLRETAGDSVIVKFEQELSRDYWLRVVKQGAIYDVAISLDGNTFRSLGAAPWVGARPQRVGLLAKNGGIMDGPEQDACFDFFEVRRPTAAEKEDPCLADWKVLQGRWETRLCQFSGKILSGGTTSIEIGPETISFAEKSEVLTMPYLLDARTMPRQIVTREPDRYSYKFLTYA